MHSYLIYQRPVSDALQSELNNDQAYDGNIQTPRANAYLSLLMIGRDELPEESVADALVFDLYKPTMFMQGRGQRRRDTLENIFAEGNGVCQDELDSWDIMKHSSISVGDLVVCLDDNTVHVCLPMGWHELYNTKLNLEIE